MEIVQRTLGANEESVSTLATTMTVSTPPARVVGPENGEGKDIHERSHHSRRRRTRRKVPCRSGRSKEIPFFIFFLGFAVSVSLAFLTALSIPDDAHLLGIRKSDFIRVSESSVSNGRKRPLRSSPAVVMDGQEHLQTERMRIETVGGQRGVGYHVVFSTSCSTQQHWESYILFYHAWKVGQPGNVTRIVSGCNDKEREATASFHRDAIAGVMSSRFRIHFTPGYVKTHTKRVYKYMNKPYGLRHWMENVLGCPRDDEAQQVDHGKNKTFVSSSLSCTVDDDIIILIDPDQILTRPLTHDFSSDPTTIWALEPSDPTLRYVRHGNPIAQQDGYLTSKWLELDTDFITNSTNSPAKSLHRLDGPRYYNAGPPYMATVKDMYNIVLRWTAFAPRVHQVFPKLFAEMFAYCFAAAHLRLPHTMVQSIVVSFTWSSSAREGWDLVDNAPSVCPYPDDDNGNSHGLPIILHYCKRYMIGRYFWSKYRLRKDLLSCEAPLLEDPTPDVANLDWWLPVPEANGNPAEDPSPQKHRSAKVAKREAFMICALFQKVNEAIEHYKRHNCPNGTANLNRTYSLHLDPSSHNEWKLA